MSTPENRPKRSLKITITIEGSTPDDSHVYNISNYEDFNAATNHLNVIIYSAKNGNLKLLKNDETFPKQ